MVEILCFYKMLIQKKKYVIEKVIIDENNTEVHRFQIGDKIKYGVFEVIIINQQMINLNNIISVGLIGNLNWDWDLVYKTPKSSQNPCIWLYEIKEIRIK